MFPQRHRTLALGFWLCWLGTVMIPFTLLFMNTFGPYAIFDFLYIPLLCLLSARCVYDAPLLAKIGMFTLGIGAILVPACAMAYNYFGSSHN